MTAPALWKAYAIRYASTGRTVRGNFLHSARFVDDPMRLDFFIWAVVGEADGRVVVVDTGFSREASMRRGRVQECDPGTALAAIGCDAAGVGDVIVTHLHYDHAGNFAAFPSATFHLQSLEMAYATGPSMCDGHQSHFYETDDIGSAVHALYGGRLRFHEGDGAIASGLSVHLIGGHTAGLQVVRVHTARGWIVLASDAAHYFANKLLRNPFPAIYDEAAMQRGFDRLDELADSPDHVVPGHDPQVLQIYRLLPDVGGLDIACLHEAPIASPRLPLAGQTQP